jgi:hypothetical protein
VDEIVKELVSRLQASKVYEILAVQAKRRIKTGGADVGGYARLWADKAKLAVKVKEARKLKDGRMVGEKWKLLEHYRKGGQPLLDTRKGWGAIHSHMTTIRNGIRITLTMPIYMIFQNYGFKTSGPNFIPFEKGGKRKMAVLQAKRDKGEEATDKEKNIPGITVRGVTVPARPIYAMPSSSKQEIARMIARVLKSR